MEIRLDGRTAIITGGSKGLGLATAVRFAASGANVAILARNAAELATASAHVQAGADGQVEGFTCDVSRLDDLEGPTPPSPRASAPWISSSTTQAATCRGPSRRSPRTCGVRIST